MPHELYCLGAECGCRDEDPLRRTQSDMTADERLDVRATDRVARRVPFGLDVNAIEAETIFIDHAVDATVSRTSKLSSRIPMRTAVSHRNEQGHDDLLEKRGAKDRKRTRLNTSQ